MYRYAEYNGGLTREQFLFYEMKITASLLAQGYSKEEALIKIIEENLYQFPTERMIKSIAQGCFKRLESLENSELVRELATSSMDIGKQINLYAMMRYNRIVWDFMVTVIGEKYRTQDFSFSAKDVNIFLDRLREQVDGVKDWSEATMQKIKQVLVKCLVECEYLESTKAENLLPIYLFPEVEMAMRNNNDEAAFSAFNYFE
jgi:hypothetical protein